MTEITDHLYHALTALDRRVAFQRRQTHSTMNAMMILRLCTARRLTDMALTCILYMWGTLEDPQLSEPRPTPRTFWGILWHDPPEPESTGSPTSDPDTPRSVPTH